MDTKILFLLTRTPLHVGAGSSVGAVDQPVQRERHTGFPIIPGSSVKGVLRSHLQTIGAEAVDQNFGQGGDDSRSGDISFGEARLVAFPVRSAKGSFAFAVSPLTLQRLARDAGWSDLQVPDNPEPGNCYTGSKVLITNQNETGVVLEEYRFNKVDDFPEDWEERLAGLLDDPVLKGAKGRFVLLSDGDLSHFTLNACQVNQHVRIDVDSGTAEKGGLFNEETVPSECLLYSTLISLREWSEDNSVLSALKQDQLIQFGGNSTTGLGFCTAKLS